MGPATGLPAGTPPSAPVPGPGDWLDLTRWDTWWEFNKEPFVLRRAAEGAPLTGSDDYYLGRYRPALLVDVLEITPEDRALRIVPALAELLAGERNRDIATAVLVALGKVGLDAVGFALEDALSAQIACDDQEVRETAVLALGIGGRPAALPLLSSLLLDEAEGRRLVQRSEVTARTRAFAAYGLGLLARRAADPGLRQRVHDLLLPLLQQRDQRHRDLRVAVVTALGMLRGAEGAAQQRLVWQTTEELLDYLQRDLGRGEEFAQAHAPIAIARLLGRGDSELHQRCKKQFAAILLGKSERSNPIQQSVAIALGVMTLPDAVVDEQANAALRQQWERGPDRMARNFALIALARIGGEANRSWLLQQHARSGRGPLRAWTALALGLIAAQAADLGEPDAAIAKLLADDLRQQGNQEVTGALAVALGLSRDRAAAPLLQELLQQREGNELLASHLAIGLGLAGDQAAVPLLTAVLERSARRPLLLLQCAIALGRLGDRGVVLSLCNMMRDHDGIAVLSALASALGRIGDRRALDPLLAMASDADLTKLTRAFAAVALGTLGDKELLRWNVPLAVDCNYAAAVDTLTNGSSGILDIL